MARKPLRTRAFSSPRDRERLAIVETRLDETLTRLPAEMEAAITRALNEALAKVATVSSVESLVAQIAAQTIRIQALETANAFGAGAIKVEQRVRSQAQQWAHTLFPYLVTLAAAVIGWRAFGN